MSLNMKKLKYNVLLHRNTIIKTTLLSNKIFLPTCVKNIDIGSCKGENKICSVSSRPVSG